tara:strand:- start:1244 stop:2110 length:867 start_codon:yes stop_codon:yes gene_type:complete
LKLIFRKLKNLIFKKRVYFIDSDEGLSFLKSRLTIEDSYLGIDTEFDWRRTYYPVLSLLQISTKKEIFIIDCIKIKDLKFLKLHLEDTKKTIIFHSVRNDTNVLSKCLNIHITKSFDIQIAEKIISCGEIKNYASLVFKYLNINLDKSETNSNWLKRPLASSQLVYASEDVEYLFEIARAQMKKLKKISKLKEAFEKSTEEAKMGNEDFLSMRLKKFNNKFTSLEREIFIWRENIAEKKNIPPGYIFSEKKLSKLANILRKKSYEKKEKVFKIFGDTSLSDRFLEDFS